MHVASQKHLESIANGGPNAAMSQPPAMPMGLQMGQMPMMQQQMPVGIQGFPMMGMQNQYAQMPGMNGASQGLSQQQQNPMFMPMGFQN
mmetsp:Transcript_17013/g.28753  ORF Transcript_17013/g.28753 Transcript_17013/m.28753 type:complete len:89 (-) Transcript_17013:222-488(-)